MWRTDGQMHEASTMTLRSIGLPSQSLEARGDGAPLPAGQCVGDIASGGLPVGKAGCGS